MIYFVILLIFLAIKSSSAIVTRIDEPGRNFRRHADSPPPTDWEIGLREAVYQALLRDHHDTDPSLREHLLEAPLIGRQDHASPFGDIAVIARGQLYDTPQGFKFLQDSYEDNCEECLHHNRCRRSHCQPWKSLGHHHKLLALWTVKRIRHRDPRYGHVFEIEYTISPITEAINEELVRRHGFINYNVPGHIFVIKSNPRPIYHLNKPNDTWHKNQDIGGILIGVTPDGYKQVLHSYPGFYTSYRPQATNQDQTTIDPKEYELYKKLIESLAAKTTSHRFSPATTTKQQTSSTTIHPVTTFVPVPETTILHLVPLTEYTLPPTTIKYPDHTHAVTPVQYPTTQPDIFYQTSLPTPEPPKPITVPVTTTIHYYTPVEAPPETSPSKPSPITTWRPTTKSPITVHFTTQTKTITKAPTTQLEELGLVLVKTSTEPMRPVTELPQRTRPDSINEQLPPPEKTVETTVPYVSSTVTQPTITTTLKQLKTTTNRVTTPKEKELTTMVIERIPYTEIKTTTFKTHRPTTEKIYPSTIITEDTKLNIENNIPSTHTVFLTNPPSTSSLESTTGPTQVLTNTPTIYYPTTEGAKFTSPLTTTTHYYYTFETDLPKPSTIPTVATTLHQFTETPTGTSPKQQPTTGTTTPQKISTLSPSDDFLIDTEGEENEAPSDNRKDFDEDDIFGKAPVKPVTEPTETTTKKVYIQSDISKALFGGRQAKQIKKSSKIRTHSTPKIIYNNFYAPSLAYTTQATTNAEIFDKTTEIGTFTDQSYSTSISFEVNKRNITSPLPLQVEPTTTTAKVSEIATTESNYYEIYQAELPEESEDKTKRKVEEHVDTKKVLDDFAWKLVNHAKSIDYLSKKPSRQPKYKRKSYSTKIRNRTYKKNSFSSNNEQ